MNLEQKALFGLPIHTELGELFPMSVYHYMDCSHFLQAMSFDKKRVLHEIRLAQPKEQQKSKEFTEVLTKIYDEYSLRQILMEMMPQYFAAYVEVLSRCKKFDEPTEENGLPSKLEQAQNFLLEITTEQFDELRAMILAINAQPEQTASLNPEIQWHKERALRFNNSKNDTEAPDASTLVTSVVTYTGINFNEVVNWNITQLQHMFQRVAMFQSYQSYIIFATVAGDKIEPVNWAENITTRKDSNTDSNFAVELKTFERNIGDAFS